MPMRPALLLTSALALTACMPATSRQAPSLADRVRAAAAALGPQFSDLQLTPAENGALDVTGSIQTRPFAARFPAGWNGSVVLFAHGYAAPGSVETVPSPAQDPSGGLLTAAYAQGYATAYSAYDKTGYAVRSGVVSTLALRQWLDGVGLKRAYITGASMGGNVTVALAELYPNAFVGALPYCGVVAGWSAEERYLIDFRAVYDSFTRKLPAPLALPGAGQLTVARPDYSLEAVQQSVGALFQGAASNPQLRSIIGQIAAVTGAQPDPISFITALGGLSYGLTDILQTQGGNAYSNEGKVYQGSLDDAALNSGIERVTAVPAATAYLRAWYTPTGKFSARMLSVHNTSDPLVPYLFEPEFAAIVAAAGNSANLVQQVVDPKPVNLADLKNSGPAHCYFSPAELGTAWNELRAWVEEGVKPEGGRNITQK